MAWWKAAAGLVTGVNVGFGLALAGDGGPRPAKR
jgi:hypothetical protein